MDRTTGAIVTFTPDNEPNAAQTLYINLLFTEQQTVPVPNSTQTYV